MNKCAEFNPNIFIPLAKMFGMDTTPRGLPQVGDADTNEIVWNTVGNTASIATALIGIKLIANKLARKEIDKKRKRVHENKINAMHAYSTPNTAPQVEAVKKVRELGVTKDASIGATALPIILATPAAIALTNLVSSKVKSEEEEEVDQKLAEARNELDALHAKLLKLRLKKSSSALSPDLDDDDDEDSDDDIDDDEETDEPITSKNSLSISSSPLKLIPKFAASKVETKTLGGYILAAALVAGLTGATVYTLTKDKDKERKRKKLLEKQIFAQNLTNTPNQVELLLGKHAPFPTDESRQTYIKEISDSVGNND